MSDMLARKSKRQNIRIGLKLRMILELELFYFKTIKTGS